MGNVGNTKVSGHISKAPVSQLMDELDKCRKDSSIVNKNPITRVYWSTGVCDNLLVGTIK